MRKMSTAFKQKIEHKNMKSFVREKPVYMYSGNYEHRYKNTS